MTSYSDEQLMISVGEGDSLGAFEKLIIRYEKPLLIYIASYISDFHTAQDIFQETFYRIFKHRKSFKPDLRFSPWAYRIATNLCIDELKKKTHALEVFLEDVKQNQELFGQPLGTINDGITDNSSLEKRLIKNDLKEKLRNLVKSLPEKLKTVFILSEYQGFTYGEIATILEIPLGTVQSRLHTSFKYLAKLLEEKGLIDELQ